VAHHRTRYFGKRYHCTNFPSDFLDILAQSDIDDRTSAVGPQASGAKTRIQELTQRQASWGVFQKQNATDSPLARTWEGRRGEADANTFPDRLVRRACDCTLPDDHQPCADHRSHQIRSISSKNPFEFHLLGSCGLRCKQTHAHARRDGASCRVLHLKVVNPRQRTINAAVRIAGVQGDPSPSCQRLFQWISEGQDLRHLSPQVRWVLCFLSLASSVSHFVP
jgi:hypothetical protein